LNITNILSQDFRYQPIFEPSISLTSGSVENILLDFEVALSEATGESTFLVVTPRILVDTNLCHWGRLQCPFSVPKFKPIKRVSSRTQSLFVTWLLGLFLQHEGTRRAVPLKCRSVFNQSARRNIPEECVL
jgi:hypothetical protein